MLTAERQEFSPTEVEKSAPFLSVEDEFINWLSDQDALEFFVREGLSDTLIYTPVAKNIFQFSSQHLNSTGKAPGLPTLQTEFPDYIWQTPQSEYKWIIEKLRERYQRNEVNKLVEDLAGKANDPTDAMTYLRGKFVDIEKNSLSHAHTFQPGDHVGFLRELQESILAGQFKGASVGYKEIDDFTGGLRNGQIGYLLARPKRTKTFQLLQAFIEQVRQGMNPCLFTLELTQKEIELRISCMLSGVSWDRAQKGAIMPSDYKEMNEAWEEFNSGDTKYSIDMPALDERTVPALILKADKLGAESILVSQFKYIKGSSDYYRTPYDQFAEIAVSLKQACIKPGAERPFYIEAQFNRGGDTMEDLEDFDAGKVGLTDMIPQSADILFGLFQSKELRANKMIEIGIIESRNTDKALWNLRAEFKQETELKLVAGSQH